MHLLLLHFSIIFTCSILQIESLREVEIKLYGTALVLSFVGIIKFDIDFWAIECAIARVNFKGFAELFQAFLKLLLSIVPHVKRTKIFFGPGGKVQLELETKEAVNKR